MRVVFVPIVFIGVIHLVHGRNISWKNYRVPTKVSDQTITVMSQNVKHVVSTDDMLEEIESVRPDILALTGITRGVTTDRARKPSKSEIMEEDA